jgi:hypothetical protein
VLLDVCCLHCPDWRSTSYKCDTSSALSVRVEAQFMLSIVVSLLFGSEHHNPEQYNRDFYNTEITSDVILHSKWCNISVMMKRVGCVH